MSDPSECPECPQNGVKPAQTPYPSIAYLPDAARLFELGRVVATPGALATLHRLGINPADLLWRHERGDWGNVCYDDALLNKRAATTGERILSAYSLGNGEQVWIITEHDRSATTLLLPQEY